MERKLILTAVISGSFGFLLAAVFLRVSPSGIRIAETQAPQSKLTAANAPAKPTSLLRRHERQSPEAVTETEAIIAEVLRRKEARLAAVRDRARGFLTLEDKQEIMAIEKETDLELRNTLSREAYLKYKGQEFQTPGYGRRLVESMGITEPELNAIMEYHMTMSDAYHATNRTELQTQSKATLMAKLGDARYKEYETHRSPQHIEAWSFTQRFGFEPAIAAEIAAIGKEGFEKFMSINKAALAGEIEVTQFSEQRQEVKDTGRARLTQLVGAEAADVFIRNSEINHWLQ